MPFIVCRVVYIKFLKNCIELLVSDNGDGVKGEIKEGFGLKGIREKSEKLGGSCEFSSKDGEGFEVRITLMKEKSE